MSARAELTRTVTPTDTAAAVGSGSLPVLGTPVLLAWLEASSCAAIEPHLAAGQTSVGTRVAIEHRAPSPLGAVVELLAEAPVSAGREWVFEVSARHTDGSVVAIGTVTRAVVDASRFMARLA